MPLIDVNSPPNTEFPAIPNKTHSDPYELSGPVSGTNVTIVISKGDVLRFDLINLRSWHEFWIKTSKGKGTDNGVSTGISGVGNGKYFGLLIWNTTDIDEGDYYYDSEDIDDMGGRIRVVATIGGTKIGGI